MAATGTLVHALPMGPGLKQAIVNVALDSSYVGSGGETLDLSAIFDNEVYGGHPIELDAVGGYVAHYDLAASGAPATGKVKAFYADYDAGADGALIEVAGAVDLSALDGNWVFYGR